MRRIHRGLAFVLPLCALAAACSTPRIVGDGDRAPVPAGSPRPITVGVDLVPLHIPAFIFGSPTLRPKLQAGSLALVVAAGKHPRLRVLALPSPSGTVAVDFLETSPPGHHWGEELFPAERSVFRAFARDPSLGRFLVVLTDVETDGTPDPIPLTAYRWERRDVERYAACGIPNRAIDACTSAFYERADTRIVNATKFLRGA